MTSENFNIYIDRELKKELKKIAIDKDTSASEIITELVRDYLEKERAPKGLI